MPWQFDNNIPVYLQIMDVIKGRIIKGEYKAGDKLPSVRDLAQEAQVNPNTMQKAMQELERESLIFSQRTSGRYVTYDERAIFEVKKTMASEIIKEFIDRMTALGFTKEEIAQLIKE